MSGPPGEPQARPRDPIHRLRYVIEKRAPSGTAGHDGAWLLRGGASPRPHGSACLCPGPDPIRVLTLGVMGIAVLLQVERPLERERDEGFDRSRSRSLDSLLPH